ncbi:MAG: hypothetical protein FWG15_02805 [Propionibacteriaceae bacterium]|nr:hypothetical protein [Propionibacteriaceae bacterium]
MKPVDGRRAVELELDLFTPIGTPNGPRWKWIMKGEVFEQIGEAEDFSTGPWEREGGLRINLRRTSG